MNRRYFLLGSAAVAAQRAAYPQSEVGVGMIGTGNRGSFVLQGVVEQPGIKVNALCDLKPDRLDKGATLAARDKPATLKDYRELLARKDIDAVFIETPCDLHVEMAIAALKAGKHVYCEKPAGITPESIRELVKAVHSSDRVFQIGQQMRSFVRLRRTIDAIHDGAAGEVMMIKAQRHASADLPHDSSSADWFFDAKRSGDVIVEMSVHNLDVCNWAANSHPERAAGFGEYERGGFLFARPPLRAQQNPSPLGPAAADRVAYGVRIRGHFGKDRQQFRNRPEHCGSIGHRWNRIHHRLPVRR